jgi:L-arabinose isomerase
MDMKGKIKVALLPLYLELYDQVSPDLRKRHEKFIRTIAGRLGEKGLSVDVLAICRKKEEFALAVRQAEASGACAIITLHIAYSPSLESIEDLAKTALPIVVLDTTPSEGFGQDQSSEEISYNHGIHGVQDMCNLLIRHKKDFLLEAGHWEASDVLDRVAVHTRGARMAWTMRHMRVGRIGRTFHGMGDFSVDPVQLRDTLGITTVSTNPQSVARLLPGDNDPEVDEEIKMDSESFDASSVKAELHRLSVRTGLAVRRWIEKEKLTAFSVNFLEITSAAGLPVMPFLEASKAMTRGTGYAGEGDVLTASLVGAVASVEEEVSFTEMFCPDWKGGTIFLSHMGEINLNLAAKKPVLLEKKWTYTDAEPPVFASAAFKPGQAAIVNLAPGPERTYSLIIAPVSVTYDYKKDNFKESIRGWIKPALDINEFLERYSSAGGTHHKALVYGGAVKELQSFAKIMGWNVITIE